MDKFNFIRRVGTLHIIFNDVIDNVFVGFVSKGELVLVEYIMGDAIRGGRLSRNLRRGGGGRGRGGRGGEDGNGSGSMEIF